MPEINDLVRAARNRNLLLFVGAGVSMNLGLPSWTQLMVQVAKELGYDPDIFKGFGDNLVLAEYYKATVGSLKPLIEKMDREWHNSEFDVSKSSIHRLIVDIAPSLIYTTNYDRWLEAAFDYYKKKYVKIVTVSDIGKAKEGVTQIVKFHGDLDYISSIVLTESSYFERLSFESPLDIKFRADTLHKTILFVGYGLNDINVRYMLYRLARIWADVKTRGARPQSYIFLSRPNPIREKVLENQGVKAIVSKSDNEAEGLTDLLKRIADGVSSELQTDNGRSAKSVI